MRTIPKQTNRKSYYASLFFFFLSLSHGLIIWLGSFFGNHEFMRYVKGWGLNIHYPPQVWAFGEVADGVESGVQYFEMLLQKIMVLWWYS